MRFSTPRFGLATIGARHADPKTQQTNVHLVKTGLIAIAITTIRTNSDKNKMCFKMLHERSVANTTRQNLEKSLHSLSKSAATSQKCASA